MEETNATKLLMARYEELVKENLKLKEELEKEVTTRKNYWQTIVWLRSQLNERNDQVLEPCPFCGGQNAGLEGSTSDSKWFIMCDCGATGSECDTEAEAIRVWNDAANKNKQDDTKIE